MFLEAESEDTYWMWGYVALSVSGEGRPREGYLYCFILVSSVVAPFLPCLQEVSNDKCKRIHGILKYQYAVQHLLVTLILIRHITIASRDTGPRHSLQDVVVARPWTRCTNGE
jgi:hypothetical protein